MQGYRKNVAMVVLNKNNQVLLCRRKGTENWQFPQGGIDQNELCEDAMYRELYEEVGLKSSEVEILGKTKEEIKYDIPITIRSRVLGGKYKGQINGSYNDLTCFSFYPAKNMFCFGDGGAVVGNKKYIDTIRKAV